MTETITVTIPNLTSVLSGASYAAVGFDSFEDGLWVAVLLARAISQRPAPPAYMFLGAEAEA